LSLWVGSLLLALYFTLVSTGGDYPHQPQSPHSTGSTPGVLINASAFTTPGALAAHPTQGPTVATTPTVFVFFTNRKYLDKVEFTMGGLRGKGKWEGDVVLIAHPDNFPNSLARAVKKHRLILFPHPLLDLAPLVAASQNFRADWKVNTSEGKEAWRGRDERQWAKTVQWHKLLVFHPYFAQWRTVVFLDGGTHVLHPVTLALGEWEPLVQEGFFLARTDSYGVGGQLDATVCPSCVRRVLDTCTGGYNHITLQTGIFAFATSWHIKGAATLEAMVKRMVDTPIWYTNEQALLGVTFTCDSNDFLPIHVDNGPLCTASDVFIRGPANVPVTVNMYRNNSVPCTPPP
jgi:hypothetical protein